MLAPAVRLKEIRYTKLWVFQGIGGIQKKKMQELIDAGRVIQLKPGNVPMYKRYLDETKGVPMTTNWNDISLIRGWSSEKLGYPTQKPEALLERIISASSNEGDTILDAYCGCGTTVAVAQRLKRNWIGIDITYQSVALDLRRLESAFGKAVLDEITLNGIPRDMKSAVARQQKMIACARSSRSGRRSHIRTTAPSSTTAKAQIAV
jgi:site-specific DNA-methyltransferase (adenine-specific)